MSKLEEQFVHSMTYANRVNAGVYVDGGHWMLSHQTARYYDGPQFVAAFRTGH